MKILRPGALWAAALLLVSCGGIRHPAPPVRQFLPEYEAPAPASAPRLPAGVAVEGFSASAPFDTRAMVYRKASGDWSEYPYERWRARPGEMISDYLARDLGARGGFALAAWPAMNSHARFHLSGLVREFFENDGPGGWEAVLAVDVVLTDEKSLGVADRVLFQRSYRASFPAGEKSPQAVARAMGKSLMDVSLRVSEDAYKAVAGRLANPSGEEAIR